MRFWNRDKKPEPKKAEEQTGRFVPPNPYVAFELVDGVHLEISMGWPPECDIKAFAHVLALINSGSIIAPQLTEATLYANQLNQPEKALAILAALDTIQPAKKRSSSRSKAIVPPSRFMHIQMKNFKD